MNQGIRFGLVLSACLAIVQAGIVSAASAREAKALRFVSERTLGTRMCSPAAKRAWGFRRLSNAGAEWNFSPSFF